MRVQRWASGAAILTAAMLTVAASGSGGPMTGRGTNGSGMTGGYFQGHAAVETYSKGYYCDTSVAAASSSGCELGASANRPPPGHYDPEYATVPVGFTVPAMQMNCPPHLVCVDHPATIDMTRVAKPLAKAMKTTVAALLPSLGDALVPGHDHYLTTLYNGEPQWWNVRILPVTSRATYDAIRQHGSYAYVQSLLAAGDPTIMKPVPTNLFLYFSARGSEAM